MRDKAFRAVDPALSLHLVGAGHSPSAVKQRDLQLVGPQKAIVPEMVSATAYLIGLPRMHAVVEPFQLLSEATWWPLALELYGAGSLLGLLLILGFGVLLVLLSDKMVLGEEAAFGLGVGFGLGLALVESRRLLLALFPWLTGRVDRWYFRDELVS